MLLGNDQNVRTWFAEYVHSSQKRKSDALILVRAELLKQLRHTIDTATVAGGGMEDFTVKGAVLMRLYCALRGIAGLKLVRIRKRHSVQPYYMRFV